MSLFRPTCAALVRRLCTAPQHSQRTSRYPISAFLEANRPPRQQCRFFSPTFRLSAKVIDPPADPVAPQPRKRTVHIGPLPKGRVDEATIRRIFDRQLSAVDGNNVLRILHHRRTAGSLADYGVDNLGKNYTHVTHELALKGLEWLRDRYPIDEARAAEEWADKEANRIAYELWLADPETESKYKDPVRAFQEQMNKEEQEREQHERDHRKIGMLHAGKSQFELHIEEKRRKRLEEVTKKAEEKERNEKEMEAKIATGEWVRTPSGTQIMKPDQTTYIDIFGREQVSLRKEENEKYAKSAVTNSAKNIEELLTQTTLAQRLYPMSAFVLFVVIFCLGFAHYYVPPAPAYRIFPDLSPTTATLAVLIGINCIVSIAWRWMPLWPLMTRFFMHVPGYPRAVQAVGNVFSHIQMEHLLANMLTVLLVGPVCHDLVGRGTFVATYISAGAVGTLFSLYWANLGRGNIAAHSVGASAAVWGISALYCLLTDKETIKIPFIKDMEVAFWPKMLFLAFVVVEIYTALKRKTVMDHASHFGGIFVGISAAGYMRADGFLQRRKAQREQDGVQARAGVDEKTVDVGAIAKQELEEIEQEVLKAVNSSKK